MASSTDEEFDGLVFRIQSLPQELTDRIQHFTFTYYTYYIGEAPSMGRITRSHYIRRVTNLYLPPTLLQVSHATREQFAASYYTAQPAFTFAEYSPVCWPIPAIALTWHQSLHLTHRALVPMALHEEQRVGSMDDVPGGGIVHYQWYAGSRRAE